MSLPEAKKTTQMVASAISDQYYTFAGMKQWENIRFKTGEEYYTRVQIIYYLLVIIPMVAFAFFYLEARKAEYEPLLEDSTQQLLLIGLPIGAFLSLILAFVLFYRIRNEAKLAEPLRRKLEVLYRANMWKYVGLTSATIMIAIGMWLTRQEVMGAWLGILLFLWSWNVPTRQRFGRDLKLSKEDRKKLVMDGEIE